MSGPNHPGSPLENPASARGTQSSGRLRHQRWYCSPPRSPGLSSPGLQGCSGAGRGWAGEPQRGLHSQSEVNYRGILLKNISIHRNFRALSDRENATRIFLSGFFSSYLPTTEFTKQTQRIME